MAVTINSRSIFEDFADRMKDFPIIRIGIVSVLCGVACFIFSLFNICVIFFAAAGLAIISRIFSMVFMHIRHILMEISMVSCWLGIHFGITAGVISIFLPHNENVASGYLLKDLPKFLSLLFEQGFANESILGIIVLVLTILSSACLVLFVIMLIIRIAVALFSM